MVKIKYLTIYFSFVCALFLSCKQNDKQKIIKINEKSSRYKKTWSELIKDSSAINLKKSGLQKKLTAITQLEFLSTGDLVMPDGYNKAIYVLNKNGAVRKKIKNIGKGPGEFKSISRIAVNPKNNNIYVFDPSQRKMIVFKFPNFIKYNEYISKKYFSRFSVISGSERLVTYSPYTEYLFNIVNLKSKKISNSAIIPNDSNFKIWMDRIQSGGIVYDKKRKKLYGLYPQNLMIYEFSKDLRLLAKLIPKSNRNFYDKFPEKLNPYHDNKLHREWWNSFDHLSRIKLFKNSKIVVTYYVKSKTKGINRVHLNIYDLKKHKIIADDIKLPKYANLAGVHDGMFFISYKIHVNHKNEEVPFRLYKYKLNIN